MDDNLDNNNSKNTNIQEIFKLKDNNQEKEEKNKDSKSTEIPKKK